jgi:hypothetical protein
MTTGGINNAEEEYYGLAQGNILDVFLHRTLRRNWLSNTGGNIVTHPSSVNPSSPIVGGAPEPPRRQRRSIVRPTPRSGRRRTGSIGPETGRR